MESASQAGAFDNIEILVNKHVQEIERTEKRWDEEIREAKIRQKSEYHFFVDDSYKKLHIGPTSKSEVSVQKAYNVTATKGGPSTPSKGQGGIWQSALNVFRSTPNAPSGGGIGGRDITTNDSISQGKRTGLGEPPHSGSSQSQAAHPSDIGYLGGVAPEDIITVVAMLGNQLKTPYELQVYRGTTSSVFTKSKPGTSQKFIPSQKSPYGNSLSAVLLLVDPDLSIQSQSMNGTTVIPFLSKLAANRLLPH
jgi:hypothetical protein